VLPRRRRRRRHRRRRRRHKCGMFPRIPLVRARSAAAVPLYFVLRLIFFPLPILFSPLRRPISQAHAHTYTFTFTQTVFARAAADHVFPPPPPNRVVVGHSPLSRTRSPPACTRVQSSSSSSRCTQIPTLRAQRTSQPGTSEIARHHRSATVQTLSNSLRKK